MPTSGDQADLLVDTGVHNLTLCSPDGRAIETYRALDVDVHLIE